MAVVAWGVSSSPAQADLFYLQDPVSKLSVAYPDTWRRVYNQKPDDVITIAAPGVENFASCRIRMREEKRFAMYPARFDGANNRSLVNEGFWDEYLAEYPVYKIEAVTMDTGLGRGAASEIQATYYSFDDPRQQKQAVIYASLYNNKIYIVDCAAKVDAYQRHYPQFKNIIKSIGFRKEQHELRSGDYRDFTTDDPTFIRNERYNRVRWWDGLKEYW
ncbi:MAG: hypothetical protein LRZ85_04860 [Alphaproteobacteria bacterium]|nr:hypothetical protein [Alphaproteobacteria bacterium]